ncbi:MAG: NAD(P)H-dependent oxidoreductase subunit E, partial [Candidatus Sulfotelmatobacter sp.]
GTACYIKGANQLLAVAEQALNVKAGETTQDGNVSLVSARCIGSCSMAPAFIFDGETAGNVSEAVLRKKLDGWKN